MSDVELLATECRPTPDCPKVVRVAPGALVVVGDAVSPTTRRSSSGGSTGHVAISVGLLGAALDRLAAAPPITLGETGTVVVGGEPVTDPRLLVEFGVGPGKGAVRISEFERMQREAFRLQQYQSYGGVRGPEWDAWQAGLPIPPITPETNEFQRKTAAWTAEGKRIYDVHILEWPLAEYTRYALAVIPMTSWDGSETFMVDRDAHPDLATLTEDVWMFDESVVAIMNYDEDEAFVGATAPTDPVADYVARRDLAMAHAVPFDQWMYEHRDRLDR